MHATPARAYRCRGPRDGWSFTIAEGGTVIVGRSAELSDVAIPFTALARQDTRFRNENGILTVECMSRRGSLLVNGECIPMQGRWPLRPGDEIILLGKDVAFVVEVVDD
jgi:hypothetical protein